MLPMTTPTDSRPGSASHGGFGQSTSQDIPAERKSLLSLLDLSARYKSEEKFSPAGSPETPRIPIMVAPGPSSMLANEHAGTGELPHANRYINSQQLRNLKLYKYGAVDKSYVSKYILQPYWTWAVELFPLWMAPNLITLIGFSFVFFNYLCAICFVPGLDKALSPIFYYSCAIGLWLYSTFDNVDGKQARRTRSSSPLGELFDHGFDALNCGFGAVVTCACLTSGQSWYTAAFTFLGMIPFYTSTWEEYHTGVLYLGYINGPTEGIMLACLIMAWSGWAGPSWWWQPLHHVSPLGAAFMSDGSLVIDLLVWLMAGMVVFLHLPGCLYNVWQACKTKQHMRFSHALLELIPISMVCLLSYLWLSAPESVLLTQHLTLFISTVAIVFGQMATKIILSHVTKAPFPVMNFLLAPLAFGTFVACIPRLLPGVTLFTPSSEVLYVWLYLIINVVLYIDWAIKVIGAICGYLRIECLRIPH